MRYVLGFLGISAILLIAGYFGLRYLFLGSLVPPDFHKLALEGQPTVQAVYEFKQQSGLWPLSIQELIPQYLEKSPGPDWEYSYYRKPYLSRHVYLPHTGINYYFKGSATGWVSEGDFGSGPIALAQPATTRPAPAPAQQFSNAIAVLDARILATPADFERHRDKIVFLVHREHRPEAFDLARKAATAFPAHWWPSLAAAELATGEDIAAAVKALCDWADANPCFNNYWYVADYFRRHNNPEMTSAMLEKAAAYPVVLSRQIDHYVPDFFCFDAAAYACKMQKYELTLKICRQWDAMTKAQGYGGNDAMAIRCAACLGLGRIDEARSLAAQAIEQGRKQAGWACDLDRLNAAAQAGNSSFIYDATAGGSVGTAPMDVFEGVGEDE